MKISVALGSTLLQDLPQPSIGAGRVGHYAARPHLIYQYTLTGELPAPTRKILKLQPIVANSDYDDLSLRKFRAYSEKYRQIGDLDTRKVLKYLDLLKAGQPLVPVMAIKFPDYGIQVIDGYHRVAAAHYAGFSEIPAYVWSYAKIKDVLVQPDRRSKPRPVVFKV